MEDAEEGFYVLKKEERDSFDAGPALMEGLPRPAAKIPRFVLSGEIATIYKKDGKTRKIHHVVILPNFRAAAAFNARLEKIGGNIRSDGRPILGIDSRDLLALLLEADERAMLIPAHIWTPWFSALGAKSGFDSIAECYGDLTGHIPAIETGLSSNPPMNWALKSLDSFSIISNSDAHSPDRLGREATIFEMEISYSSLRKALSPCSAGITGTIEFFPQEGKYHYDGHRNCGVSLGPEQAASVNYLCPVCGKVLTRGVMGRVLELADQPVDEEAKCPPEYQGTNRRPCHSLIPLRELTAELLGTGAASKKTETAYYRLIEKGGSEFSILLNMDRSGLEQLKIPGLSGEMLARAIMKMRAGEVFVSPGYDGEYGSIRVFARRPESGAAGSEKNLFGEIQETEKQESPRKEPPLNTIASPHESPPPEASRTGSLRTQSSQTESLRAESLRTEGPARPLVPAPEEKPETPASRPAAFGLDPDQEKAVSYNGKETIVIAGPGTGKTAVLTARIARLIQGGASPASILALTFTVRAAAELRERIERLCGPAAGPARGAAEARVSTEAQAAVTAHEATGARPAAAHGAAEAQAAVTAATFHSFCCLVLREHCAQAGLPPDFKILGEKERDALLREISSLHAGERQAPRLGSYIEERKRYLLLPGEEFPKFLEGALSLTREQWDSLRETSPDIPADAGMEALYAEYRRALRESLSLDFEDLCAGTVRLLASYPEILERYRKRFRHVFVDEYQYINFTQYILIRLLVNDRPDSPSLWVIGDPNQAIYGFRGSDKRFIGRFLSDYPGAGRFELARSYRCAEPIINAAGKLAKTGPGSAESRSPLKVAEVSLFRTQYATEKSEAEGIARTIEALIGGTSFFAMDSGSAASFPAGNENLGPEDCAILVRAAALAAPIVKALNDHGIPCEFAGEGPWWKEEPAATLLEVLREAEIWKKNFSGGGPAARTPADSIKAAWEEIAKSEKPGQTGKKVPGAVERLISLAGLFGDLGSFFDTLDSCAASGIPEPGTRSIHSSGVKVMTIHASKGLEFEQVFVAGLEEGILPFTLFNRAGEEPDDRTEEERRLLYVGMTRAKRGLWLSWAESRMYRGIKLKGRPSRFLAELEKIIPLAPELRKAPWDGQLSLF